LFEGIQCRYAALFDNTRTGSNSPQQILRIKRYNEATASGAWMVFTYEVCDWNLSQVPLILKTSIGEVLQFKIYRNLKEELDSDIEKIAYEEIKRKH